MKRKIYVLSALLAIQVLLVIAGGMSEYGHVEDRKDNRLVHFRPEEINRMVIKDNEGREVILTREGSEWKLPDYYNFPADSESVRKLLKTMAGLKSGWPVATTGDAAGRFRVSQDRFERRITLFRGDDRVADVFFGTSPGIKKIHARADGETDIYEVRFSLFQADTSPDTWINRHVLRIEPDAIVQVRLPDITLEKVDGKFRPSGIGDNETIVENEVRFVIDKVSGITVDGILGADAPAGFDDGQPDFAYTVITEPENREIGFVFSKPEDKSYYILKSSLRPEYFKVLEWKVNGLKDLKPDRLVRKKDPDDEKVSAD